jgi:ribosomal protein L7Ae-like RNA K-turn-binding protein
MLQTPDLEQALFQLIAKLKKLYYNRKMNPTKKIKSSRPIKKRYIIGLKEVFKHLNAENLKMVILATNLEHVEGEKGLDDLVYHII